tara:strand:- start:958 stop:1191 length:234 start_codon:yes stop_codon:yes gene_type:complete
MDSEIIKLTKNLTDLVDFSIDNLDEKALTEIRDRMEILIEQEAFWIKQESKERFHYELKKFLTWLCDYALMKNDEND